MNRRSSEEHDRCGALANFSINKEVVQQTQPLVCKECDHGRNMVLFYPQSSHWWPTQDFHSGTILYAMWEGKQVQASHSICTSGCIKEEMQWRISVKDWPCSENSGLWRNDLIRNRAWTQGARAHHQSWRWGVNHFTSYKSEWLKANMSMMALDSYKTTWTSERVAQRMRTIKYVHDFKWMLIIK